MGVLRARVGGAWVDIVGGAAGGGTDEVWLGPDDPIATSPTIELWYDTDDDYTNALAPTAVAGNALGVVAIGTMANYSGQSIPSNVATQIGNTITYTPLVGRRYRVRAAVRAMSPSPSAVGVQMGFGGSVVANNQMMAYVTGAYASLTSEALFNGTGNSETFTMTLTPINAAVNVWADQSISYFYIEDVGPSSSPALPVTLPYQAWTPVAYNNTWTDYGSGLQGVGYRKVGDIVSVRGTCKGGTIGSANPIFGLPVGFRPPAALQFPTDNGAKYGLLEVFTNGGVSLNSTVAGAANAVVNINFSFSVT